MDNWVTPFMCALFLLLFAVVGYMVASDWVRTVWQQVRFGRDFYGLFKADKQKWEEQRLSQVSTAREGVQTDGPPASGSEQSTTGEQQ
jgi:hypothetical protein